MTELTTLPPAEAVRRLKMAKAVVPEINPDLLDMETWFEDTKRRGPLRYVKEGIRLCGTAACFAGHLALRDEFQELGLALTEQAAIAVPRSTPLAVGRRPPSPEHEGPDGRLPAEPLVVLRHRRGRGQHVVRPE